MAINLVKGQRQKISAPMFTIGLGWDENGISIPYPQRDINMKQA